MITAATPIQFSDPLPSSADLVVIGGGIVGTTTAWFAAKGGLNVLLLEKGRIAGEQSSRNWGWIRQQGRDAAELPIMMESNHIWRGLAETTGESGLSFTESGCVYLARSDSELKRFEDWKNLARDHGLDTQILSAGDIARSDQPLTGNWAGGLLTPSDGRAEPWLAVPALARAASRQGVSIIENCAARTIETSGGAVSAVATELGVVKTRSVVLAGGAWASDFLGNLGINLPQLMVRSTVARLSAVPHKPVPNTSAPGFAMRQRDDGGYSVTSADVVEHYVSKRSFRYLTKFAPLLKSAARDIRLRPGPPANYPGNWRMPAHWTADEASPFESMRVLDPSPSKLVLKRIEKRVPEFAPWAAAAKIETAWAGMIDVTPDAVPCIGELPGLDGFFLGTGMSGHGFGIGPAVGRILADLICGKEPGHDLNRFRFERFSDGSAIVPGPY